MKRENSRERKVMVLVVEERERVDGCEIYGGGGGEDGEGQKGGWPEIG